MAEGEEDLMMPVVKGKKGRLLFILSLRLSGIFGENGWVEGSFCSSSLLGFAAMMKMNGLREGRNGSFSSSSLVCMFCKIGVDVWFEGW